MTFLSHQISFRVIDESEMQAVSGGMISHANDPGYHGPTLRKGGSVGQGDTIDVGGGDGDGDGEWQTIHNSLPSRTGWGN